MEFLGEYSWEFRMDDGLVAFSFEDGRPPIACSVQLLGTVSDQSRTWLWAWANVESDIPASLLRGAEKVREAGSANGLHVFSEKQMPLRHERLGEEIAIICSGYLECYTYFVCPYECEAVYISIEKRPSEQPLASRDVMLALKVIREGVSAFEFNHRKAVLSYLRRPIIEKSDEMVWTIGSQSIRVEFDDRDRIKCIETGDAL
jgi:hypothetical protein